MSTRGLRAVLFDWDGTLVNTAEASFRCYEKLFGSYGIAFDRDAFRRTYSPNWHLTYSALGLARERWAEADTLWLTHYREEQVVLIDGAREALSAIQGAGLASGLVTSGDRVRVAGELAALEVASFFAAVVCAEDTVNRKPHPEPLLLALDLLGSEGRGRGLRGGQPGRRRDGARRRGVRGRHSRRVPQPGDAGRQPSRQAGGHAVTEAVDGLLSVAPH